MKIVLKACYQWDNEQQQYVKTFEDSVQYTGPIDLACGSTAAQNQIQGEQSSMYQQMMSQSTAVFGNASTVFNDLVNTFAPTVAAGPSQQGFSPQQLANLNSEAITQTGQAYKNAKEAVGEAQSASGGGNTALPSGTVTGENLNLAESGANQTASELGGITQANYAQGNANYNAAVAGLSGATNVFNPATGSANATTGAGAAAATTADQIATQNNSWISGVTGALGAIGGAATGAIIKNSGFGS